MILPTFPAHGRELSAPEAMNWIGWRAMAQTRRHSVPCVAQTLEWRGKSYAIRRAIQRITQPRA